MADSEEEEEEYHSAEESVNDTPNNKAENIIDMSQMRLNEQSKAHSNDNSSDNNLPQFDRDNRTVGEDSSGVEYVSNLDNRYVSEGTDEIVSDKVELTEEQVKEMKEQATKLKESGNQSFREGDLSEAVKYYTEALELYPPTHCEHEIAVCHANRAACYIKLEQHEDVVKDCTKALELKPDYLKALMRRAQSYEVLEKLEQALEDYKKVLELDSSQPLAKAAVMRLPAQIQEQHEKMKAEMLGQLKELGNTLLKPFGLSTNNFQFQKDPNTGGYSVNFQK